MLCIRSICILAFLVLVHGSSGFEPKCSPFDYDKQLLERMIEREFEFRAVRDEIKQTSVNVKQGLDDVKEDMKLVKQQFIEFKETQENKLTASVEEFKSDGNKRQLDFAEFKKETTNEFESKSAKLDQVFEQQQAVITRMSSDLQEMENKTLQEIKAAVKPIVAFRTSASSAFTLPTDKPIIFQSVDFNIGNAYDGNTGIFTAPVDGTFLFTVHMCMGSSKHVSIHIMVDNVSVTRSHIHAVSNHQQCLTETDVLSITAGAQVWIIRSNWRSAFPFMYNSISRAYFTGLLV